MATRVRDAFLRAGLEVPSIRFNFGDASVPGFVSSVDRALKRYPELKRFVTDAEPMSGIRGARRISNGPASAGAGESIPYEVLQAIAAGVPRSFPFHSAALHFSDKAFGTLGHVAARTRELLPGVLLSDRWWVKELDRTFVPDIDRVVGPTPEWYRPESLVRTRELSEFPPEPPRPFRRTSPQILELREKSGCVAALAGTPFLLVVVVVAADVFH